MSSAVAHALPPSILALFAARPPIDYKPPIEKRKMLGYTTMAQFVKHFEDPNETPAAKLVESIEERRVRIRALKEEAYKAKLDAAVETYDPANDEKIGKGDPYKTLFVARISYETTQETLQKSFEQFGPIKSCVLVHDTLKQKPRGYAFIEFEHERDMKTAYKQGDGRKIDNRRVLVDVERGRTVLKWRPRRLGGGLGQTRLAVSKGTKAGTSTGGRDYHSGPSMVGSSSNVGGGGGYSSSSRPAPSPGGAMPAFSWSSKTETDESRGGYSSRTHGGDRDRERERDRERGSDRDRDRRGSDRSGLGYGGGGYGEYDRRDRRDDGHDRRDDRDRGYDRERERDRDRDRDRDRSRRD